MVWLYLFFRNFNFRGMSWTDFWNIHPSIFCEYLFSFSQISVCVTPRDSLNIIFRLNALFWMSFPMIRATSCPKILNWRLDKFSSNMVWLCFFEISISGAWAEPISAIFIHHFLWVPIQFFWNNGLCPEFFKYHFSTKCSISDEFSRNRTESC